MADLIADGAMFQCDKGGMHKLNVIVSPASGDSKAIAGKVNCILVPQGTPCSLLYGVPCPMPVSIVSKEGQETVKVGALTALGAGCEFQCPMGGKLSSTTHGQDVGKHNEASPGLQAASIIADFVPVVSTIKSIFEVVTGKDPVTGEETSRLAAAAGIVPGGKAIAKGGKAIKAIVKGEKAAVKAEKAAVSSAKVAAKSEKTATKTSNTASKQLEPPHKSQNKVESPPPNKAANDNNIQAANDNRFRTEPKNLEEKLALDEAKAGSGRKIEGFAERQNDPRYPPEQWTKMEHVHPKKTDRWITIKEGPKGEIIKTTTKPKNIDIHFWENRQTGERHGFKFKNP